MHMTKKNYVLFARNATVTRDVGCKTVDFAMKRLLFASLTGSDVYIRVKNFKYKLESAPWEKIYSLSQERMDINIRKNDAAVTLQPKDIISFSRHVMKPRRKWHIYLRTMDGNCFLRPSAMTTAYAEELSRRDRDILLRAPNDKDPGLVIRPQVGKENMQDRQRELLGSSSNEESPCKRVKKSSSSNCSS